MTPRPLGEINATAWWSARRQLLPVEHRDRDAVELAVARLRDDEVGHRELWVCRQPCGHRLAELIACREHRCREHLHTVECEVRWNHEPCRSFARHRRQPAPGAIAWRARSATKLVHWRRITWFDVELPGLWHLTDAHGTTRMGILRRPIQRDSETGAMPSRAAAAVRLRESRSATSRRVAFSISGSDDTACSRTQARSIGG